MPPMHHSRNNETIDIREDFFERFAFLGWLRRERRQNCARLIVRRNAQRSNFFPIIGDPIRELV